MMEREELKEKLREAGFKYDGHVTTGSLEEQMKVIDDFVTDAICFATRTVLHATLSELARPGDKIIVP